MSQTIESKFTLLNQISTRLQGLIQSKNFYQEVVNLIHHYLSYDCILIFSVDDGDATLRAQAGGYSGHLRVGFQLKAQDSGIIHHVINSKEAYLANNTQIDPFFTNLSLPVSSQAELATPIMRDGKVLAVLNVESNLKNSFDDTDLRTLLAISSQIAVALENQRLYTNTLDFNRSLQEAVESKTRALLEAQKKIVEQQKLLEKENEQFKTLQSKEHKKFEFLGESEAIQNLVSMVDKIAPTLAAVLVQGESGTGKDVIARRLHTKSNRVNKPFVSLNCSSLQDTLLESELFGHEEGAFSDATSLKKGLAEVADGGTLFLDDITELSSSMQTKLLRFLTENEFFRVGGKVPIRSDVRIVSATSRDLESLVRSGKFREDLYYRLNTITLRVPPLRKRSDDIDDLVFYFLGHFKINGFSKTVHPDVLSILRKYDWPGNIRELQNTVERMVILSDGAQVQVEDIPFGIRSPKSVTKNSDDIKILMPLDEIEKRHILKTLEFFQGNKTKAAESLNITIKTLYNKLKTYES